MKISFQQASILAQKHLTNEELDSLIRFITPRKVAQLLSLNPELSLREIQNSGIVEILKPSRAVYFYTALITGRVESIFDFIDDSPGHSMEIKKALKYLLKSVDKVLTDEGKGYMKFLVKVVFPKLKQKDIADSLGVTRPYYNYIINGKKPFSRPVFCSLLLELSRLYPS